MPYGVSKELKNNTLISFAVPVQLLKGWKLTANVIILSALFLFQYISTFAVVY